MASYCPITLPAVAALRSYALSTLSRNGATIYQRGDGSYVASRASWPSPPEGPDPTTLTETPADPTALGWTLRAAPPPP